MKRNPVVAAPRVRLGLLATLGLHDPDLPNWARVRAARLDDLGRMLPFARGVTLFNAVMLGIALWGAVPAWQILIWLGGIGAIVADSIGIGRVREPLASASPFIRMLRAVACGMLWAVPPLLFADGRGAATDIAVCLVSIAVIASAPLILSALPLAMCGLVLPVAIGLTVMMARAGSPLLALLAPIYAVALLGGGLAVARGALRRRLAETALTEESETVSLLLHEFADDGAHWLWEIDVRKRLMHVTPRLAEALGRPAEALSGQPLIACFADGWPGADGPPPQLRALLDLLDGRVSFRDHWLPLMVAGERRWWRLSGTPRHEADGTFSGFRGVGADVTDQRRQMERMSRQARVDGLTGIDNRTGFTERLRAAIARSLTGSPPCALLLVDLDRFKVVNDTYGHPVGDKLLHAVAARLSGLTRKNGACGRLGGDEFAMFVADARDPTTLAALARTVQAALLQPFEVDGRVLHIGGSVGVAVAPGDGATMDVLMRNADAALYRAKREGGRPCHYVPEMHDRDERRAALVADLPHALARNQLTLGFAPVVAAPDGRLVAFAAMMAWHHPLHGVIPAEETMRLAVAARQFVAIGDWLLHNATQEASRWPEDVRLLIGLSPAQVRDPRTGMAIRVALAVSGIPVGRLMLGVPETVALDPAALTAIGMLGATGARLSIDGFETGFAALRGGRYAVARLASGLVDEATQGGAEATGLVRALVAMAETTGVETLACDVRTPAARARAIVLGCDLLEGATLPAAAACERARRGEMRARAA